jgi:hypothetical protein
MTALLADERLIDTGEKMLLSLGLGGGGLIYYKVGDPHCTGHFCVGTFYGWHRFKEEESKNDAIRH